MLLIKNKIFNLKNLSLKEIEEVLEWRNHPATRKWMYNKKKLSLSEFMRFINNKNIVYLKVADIGVIAVFIKQSGAVIGIYKNPLKRKVGDVLLKNAVNIARKYSENIFVFVNEKNKRALNLYKRFGFKTVSKRKNILKMKLEI